MSEVNPDIKSINIKVDQSRGVLIPSITLGVNNQERVFSFDKISDGTVKWIALCVDLLSLNTFSAIEEPENFLHPRMQELFISLVRNVCEKNAISKIVSTHSESLLNLCAPNELIIFDFDENGTTASRPDNMENLEQVLANSDFELGYFYRTGVLSV